MASSNYRKNRFALSCPGFIGYFSRNAYSHGNEPENPGQLRASWKSLGFSKIACPPRTDQNPEASGQNRLPLPFGLPHPGILGGDRVHVRLEPDAVFQGIPWLTDQGARTTTREA